MPARLPTAQGKTAHPCVPHEWAWAVQSYWCHVAPMYPWAIVSFSSTSLFYYKYLLSSLPVFSNKRMPSIMNMISSNSSSDESSISDGSESLDESFMEICAVSIVLSEWEVKCHHLQVAWDYHAIILRHEKQFESNIAWLMSHSCILLSC